MTTARAQGRNAGTYGARSRVGIGVTLHDDQFVVGLKAQVYYVYEEARYVVAFQREGVSGA
jgi:hypothetical protein